MWGHIFFVPVRQYSMRFRTRWMHVAPETCATDAKKDRDEDDTDGGSSGARGGRSGGGRGSARRVRGRGNGSGGAALNVVGQLMLGS